jgi:hypothetical protein
VDAGSREESASTRNRSVFERSGAGSREENAPGFEQRQAKNRTQRVLFSFSNAASAISVMVVVVMMMVVVATWAHDDHWPISAPGMMMVVMVVVILRKLDVVTCRGNWP